MRKTAAHAIPKLYSIDPDSKEELIGLIEKLLGDRTTLVVGSAVMAFEEVCPERTELIHKQFRKLCNLLADIDEWGQVCNSDQLKVLGRFVLIKAYYNVTRQNLKKQYYLLLIMEPLVKAMNYFIISCYVSFSIFPCSK